MVSRKGQGQGCRRGVPVSILHGVGEAVGRASRHRGVGHVAVASIGADCQRAVRKCVCTRARHYHPRTRVRSHRVVAQQTVRRICNYGGRLAFAGSTRIGHCCGHIINDRDVQGVVYSITLRVLNRIAEAVAARTWCAVTGRTRQCVAVGAIGAHTPAAMRGRAALCGLNRPTRLQDEITTGSLTSTGRSRSTGQAGFFHSPTRRHRIGNKVVVHNRRTHAAGGPIDLQRLKVATARAGNLYVEAFVALNQRIVESRNIETGAG